jgi:hypothetical protein
MRLTRQHAIESATGPRFHPINHDDIVVLKPEVMPEGNSGRLPDSCGDEGFCSDQGAVGCGRQSPIRYFTSTELAERPHIVEILEVTSHQRKEGQSQDYFPK